MIGRRSSMLGLLCERGAPVRVAAIFVGQRVWVVDGDYTSPRILDVDDDVGNVIAEAWSCGHGEVNMSTTARYSWRRGTKRIGKMRRCGWCTGDRLGSFEQAVADLGANDILRAVQALAGGKYSA